MKLKDWADKQGIAYLTAWRWFKAKDPRLANAYQSDSGTIIVPDESDALEQPVGIAQSNNDVMSLVLKKTVECSKNNSSVEEFAAWILSNFNLKPHGQADTPKYSRVKPKPEEVQNHFKQFLKPKGEKPKANMLLTADQEQLEDLLAQSDNLTTNELADEISKIGSDSGTSVNIGEVPEMQELMKDLSCAINNPVNFSGIEVKTYANVADGVVNRSNDLTPQTLNYANSSYSTLGDTAFSVATPAITSSVVVAATTDSTMFKTSGQLSTLFQPTQKEIASASALTNSVKEKPRRGRKPKNQGNNQ